jgi:signal peptidase I
MKNYQRAIFSILFLCCGILFISGLGWLSIGLLTVTLFYWLTISFSLTISRFRKIKWLSYPVYFLSIIIFSIAIRLFVLEIYAIPSVSMENTILPGDKILLNKLVLGPRMPGSPFEIPWVNIGFFLNKKSRENADSSWWQYKRLTGFSGFKRNQVIVFNLPQNPDEVLIKRCMGLPGDTLQIRNAVVYANGKRLKERNTVKFFSRVLFNNYAHAKSLFDSIGIETFYNNHNENNYLNTYLNQNQKQRLVGSKCIDTVIIEKVCPDTGFKDFTHSDRFHWGLNDFGPLIVPSSGMRIELNEDSYFLYREVINRFEKTFVSNLNGKILLDGVEATSYTFKNNYFFMLGDHRHNSRDSRYWGFVPEKYIIGKASLILFSSGEEGFRWNRLFKVIR